MADFEQAGYLVKVEEHAHAVGHCSVAIQPLNPVISGGL